MVSCRYASGPPAPCRVSSLAHNSGSMPGAVAAGRRRPKLAVDVVDRSTVSSTSDRNRSRPLRLTGHAVSSLDDTRPRRPSAAAEHEHEWVGVAVAGENGDRHDDGPDDASAHADRDVADLAVVDVDGLEVARSAEPLRPRLLPWRRPPSGRRSSCRAEAPARVVGPGRCSRSRRGGRSRSCCTVRG